MVNYSLGPSLSLENNLQAYSVFFSPSYSAAVFTYIYIRQLEVVIVPTWLSKLTYAMTGTYSDGPLQSHAVTWLRREDWKFESRLKNLARSCLKIQIRVRGVSE